MIVLMTYLVTLSLIGAWIMGMTYPEHREGFQKWVLGWCVFIISACVFSIPFILLLSVVLYVNHLKIDQPYLKAATYFATFASMPAGMSWTVPGPPGINFILNVSVNMMLLICLFGPTIYQDLWVKKKPWVTDQYDRYFVATILITVLLPFFRFDSLTGILRYGVNYFLNYVLLFFFVSRYVTRFEHIRKCLIALCMGALIVSLMAALEQQKYWYLYPSLQWSLGMGNPTYGIFYLTRAGLLRTQVTTGHPIALGIFMVIACVAAVYFWDTRHHTKKRLNSLFHLSVIGMFLLGVFNSVSKGAFLGTIVALAVYGHERIARGAIRRLIKIGTVMLVLMIWFGPDLSSFTASSSGNETVLSDTGSYTYRSQLIETSIGVILKNPIFGSFDYYNDPDMEIMRQGQGIIDITNTYLLVALDHGLVGLTLFLLLLIKPQWALYRLLRRRKNPLPPNIRAMAALLLASLFSLAVMIATVSRMGILPYLTLMLIGLSIAFIRNVDSWLEEPREEANQTS